MSKENVAVECFNNNYNCSQAVFSTYCEELGLSREHALKIACSFGAGMGRMAGTCGAVTGAFMLIGLKHGKYTDEDILSKDKTYELVREFSERFRVINGSICCKELLGCDISTSEGVKEAKEKGLWDSHCSGYVKEAALLVEELLKLHP